MGICKIGVLLTLTMLSSFLLWGCVDDLDNTLVTAPGVLQDEKSYWVDDVMVTQRHTSLTGYDTVTHYFRGSVKNMGPEGLSNSRFEIHTWDVYYDLDGTKHRRDEEIVAIQDYGILESQKEMPINIEAQYSSYATRDVEGMFVYSEDE